MPNQSNITGKPAQVYIIEQGVAIKSVEREQLNTRRKMTISVFFIVALALWGLIYLMLNELVYPSPIAGESGEIIISYPKVVALDEASPVMLTIVSRQTITDVRVLLLFDSQRVRTGGGTSTNVDFGRLNTGESASREISFVTEWTNSPPAQITFQIQEIVNDIPAQPKPGGEMQVIPFPYAKELARAIFAALFAAVVIFANKITETVIRWFGIDSKSG